MKICIWKTGHEIADRVAESLIKGIPSSSLYNTWGGFSHNNAPKKEVSIGYGILRGMDEVFKNASNNWFNVDRGYFKASHYDGYYRINCKGTQQTFNWPEADYERLNALKLDIKPWRGFDKSKPVLYCPPTLAVCDFFKSHPSRIDQDSIDHSSVITRLKGDTNPINFNDYNYVHTFNSSVGWQALTAGIPCVSHPIHSIIGSWFKNISLDDLVEAQHNDRNKLFATMAGMQFTLSEIEQGKAWPLIERYICDRPIT